jgi:hypothetical protein
MGRFRYCRWWLCDSWLMARRPAVGAMPAVVRRPASLASLGTALAAGLSVPVQRPEAPQRARRQALARSSAPVPSQAQALALALAAR